MLCRQDVRSRLPLSSRVDTPSAGAMESTRQRVVRICREKCPPRHCKGAGLCVKVLLVLVNFSFLVSRVTSYNSRKVCCH